jgi:hypothetical protein
MYLIEYLSMRKIIDLNHNEARQFFLKEESYFNFDLPRYFVFQNLIESISEKLDGKRLSDFYDRTTADEGKSKTTYPSDFENVNYEILHNKDGKYAWRPFQLIHPALYVSLVHRITEEASWDLITDKFQAFRGNSKLECHSIPTESESELSDKATSVTYWWQKIEQRSIELALDFEYVLHTDISDCYGSLYTHSIPWALHTKQVAKDSRTDYSLVGNEIDKHLRDMSFGQTNGIPQGSVLMDFIAEIVLGYADFELTKRIESKGITDYKVLRYRDDYRIFTNNPQEAEIITKILTEVLIDLGFRLNAQKTLATHNVVIDSIKADKLFWITSKNNAKRLQEQLFIIHSLSEKYPNSGSLSKALDRFYKKISRFTKPINDVLVLISMIVDIAYKNPRTYPMASAILSKLLSFEVKSEIRNKILNSIKTKFDKIPNTGHLQIWLQRITLKSDPEKEYDEILCQKVNDSSIRLWNSDWLSKSLREHINKFKIVDEQTIEEISDVIESKEVELFVAKIY